jgi:mRNA-degrading endonuclease RelE of RelBE toxin-antitoxin system
MADKIQKFLAKLSSREAYMLQSVILDILTNNIEYLDVKPLTGHKNFYRVRKGSFRIIFERDNGKNWIREARKRDDRTYSNF